MPTAAPSFVQVSPKGPTAPSPTGDPLKDALARANAHLERMLFFRRQYDQRRAFFYRQYVGQQDRRTFPDNTTPRSSTFVPYPLQNVEQIVARVSDAFFSFDPWFECAGRTAQDEPAAEAMQLVEEFKLHQAKLVPAIEALSRNIAIYGHSGIKVDWDWDYDEVIDSQPVFAQQPVVQPDPQTGKPVVVKDQNGQPQMQPVLDALGAPVILGFRPIQKKVPRQRPKFTAIDVYDMLCDPDGDQVAHIVEKSWGTIKREQEMSTIASQADPTGATKPVYLDEGFQQLQDALLNENDPDSVIFRIAEFWDPTTNTVTIQTFGNDREAISWKDLRLSFRQASYSGFKRRMYGGPAILLYHGENPFMHKRVPILHTSFIKLPNEVFGLGSIEIISDLVESLNRQVNMVADNWNLGVNRRYVYSVEADIDHAALNMFNTPGGKIGVSGVDPEKAVVPLPFFTPSRQDYAILDLYRGMIEATSGISDFYSKGVGSPENNRTATGIASVVNESNFRFKMFIRNLEIDILQPLLEMTASMIQQYMTNAEEVRITDAPVGIEKWPVVHPEDLIGNFNFDLVAANYVTNKIVRQRNLLAFANWASQTPYWNVGNGLKEIAKVFEVRNINRLIKSDQQVAIEQQQQMQQQIQMMVLEAMLNYGMKTGLEYTKAKLKPKPASGSSSKGSGRPRGIQQEGKLPGSDGAGLSMMREIGQAVGLGGMGLSGLGGAGSSH